MTEVAERGVRHALRDREMERGPETVRQQLDHWRLAVGDDGIAWLTLDRAGESTNTLSEAVLRELDAMLDAATEANPRALAIRSV